MNTNEPSQRVCRLAPFLKLSRPALCAAMLLSAAGCLQIETHIKLNEDGSAKITERIFLSDRLLDRAGAKRAEFAALLGKARLLERMKNMGEGVTLVSHKTNEGGDGWMESVAEMTIPDLNNFRYMSPWLAYGGYAENNTIRVSLKPLYKSSGDGPAGSMAVHFTPTKRPGNGKAPPALTPLQQQVYRDIAPVLKDMLKGFRVRLTFESYARVSTRLGLREVGSPIVDVIDVSDTDLDRGSGLFFANEEIMLELARLDFGGPNVAGNVQRASTLPVFLPHGGRSMWHTGGKSTHFRPSKALFERHFKGKKLDYSRWRASPPEKHVPAKWENIGWHGWKKDRPGVEKEQEQEGHTKP